MLHFAPNHAGNQSQCCVRLPFPDLSRRAGAERQSLVDTIKRLRKLVED
jgi:hypothetical protein